MTWGTYYGTLSQKSMARTIIGETKRKVKERSKHAQPTGMREKGES
jgi:hypothetical protein